MKKVLQEALDNRGYAELTPVQNAVLDPELEGRDMLVSAQTGSGKTVGFGLAIAPTILGDDEKFGKAGAPLALVIAPTRELALQVKRELAWLYEKAGVEIASCVGGMDVRDERRTLGRGAHIVAATPGRLRDHIQRKGIDLSQLQAVVLDEADEMLDLGFREDLEFILGEAPEERQTLLFSATVPKSIIRLAQNYQNRAERVVVQSKSDQHADIRYDVMNTSPHDTEKAVINTLLYHDAPNAIVFANTRAMVNRLSARLSNRGLKVVSLSGELSQAERTHALQAMRDGRARICVATDVAARGIDLPNLDLVVHAELPNNHETLLHRSGRTGRAGRKGVSALIVTKKTFKKAQRMLHMAKLQADWIQPPTADAVKERESERLFNDDTWQTPASESEQEVISKLETTFTPAQLATAYIRLYRAQRSSPEELSSNNPTLDFTPEPRQEFGPSVWFSITGGRNKGAEPRQILPMVCKFGGLNRRDIGAIRLDNDCSYVEISKGKVEAFLADLGDRMELEKGAAISQLVGEPDVADRSAKRPRKDGKFGKPRHSKSSKPFGKGGKGGPRGERGDRSERGERSFGGDKPSFKRSKGKQGPSDYSDGGGAPKPRGEAPKARADGDGGEQSLRRKPKGAKPPVGKKSSKKNRARSEGGGKPFKAGKPKASNG
ncbi:MAG: DEAD/DEAH box helicase [Hyphomicrobiales bacterium]